VQLVKIVRVVGLTLLIGIGVLVTAFKVGYLLFDWALSRAYRRVDRRADKLAQYR